MINSYLKFIERNLYKMLKFAFDDIKEENPELSKNDIFKMLYTNTDKYGEKYRKFNFLKKL